MEWCIFERCNAEQISASPRKLDLSREYRQQKSRQKPAFLLRRSEITSFLPQVRQPERLQEQQPEQLQERQPEQLQERRPEQQLQERQPEQQHLACCKRPAPAPSERRAEWNVSCFFP